MSAQELLLNRKYFDEMHPAHESGAVEQRLQVCSAFSAPDIKNSTAKTMRMFVF